MNLYPDNDPHRRHNPLTGEWTLVSPHRTQRPWQGQLETFGNDQRHSYDASCYLCPGNARANDDHNPCYSTTFVFTNDFSVLQENTPNNEQHHPLFRYRNEQGTSRVICFSPKHHLSLAELSTEEVLGVVNCWSEQVSELGQRYRSVQIFENKGAMMGCSNPHPHGQIWAQDSLPSIIEREDRHQASYQDQHQEKLLLDYARMELEIGDRVVCHNMHWVVVVPYWACWPFETLLLPIFPVTQLNALNKQQRQDLASIIKTLTCKYDNLFQCSFPYSMGWHGQPQDQHDRSHWQLHAHFYPPLLRSANIKKFMVGYELLAEAQRDITPEFAAERLRQQSNLHYKHS